MTVISWEDPPPSRNAVGVKKTKWQVIAATLREKPGQWAHVETKKTANSAAQTTLLIRTGRCNGMPEGQFEAVSRGVDDEFRVYARYVGDVTR